MNVAEIIKMYAMELKTPNVKLFHWYVEDPPRVTVQVMIGPIKCGHDFGEDVCTAIAKRHDVEFKIFDFNMAKAGEEPPNKQFVFAKIVKNERACAEAVVNLCRAEHDYYKVIKRFVKFYGDVIEPREIDDAEIEKIVLQYLKDHDGEVVYPSDIAFSQRLGARRTFEVCQKLKKEGKIESVDLDSSKVAYG